MRMQDEAKWGSEKRPLGEISDQPQPQDERKAGQKRTFTRWMNGFLHRCDPPLEVHDLFADIQDGRILMALLEELTGCKLLYRFRSSSQRIFRLNNISKALAFLDDRHVKLLGVDASGVADGIPSVVLNLVWIIILHFQVKEVTRGLHTHLSSSLSSLSASGYPSSSDLALQPNDIGSYSCKTLPSKGRKAARAPKYHGKAIKSLLQWVQRCTSKFGVEVHDFGKSWRSGLAFLAVIKCIEPDLVDLRESLAREPRENLQQAFTIAHHSFDITPLLEPEGVMCPSPDEQSIITYVSMFLGHCSGKDKDQTTDIGVPDIPNYGSLESVRFGETLADDTEAQALLRGSEESSEQLLWKRWARRSPGGPRATSLHLNDSVTSHLSSSDGDIVSSCCRRSITEQSEGSAATSPFNKKRGRHRSVLQPPSPLDAGVVNPAIRSWMEKSSNQVHGKSRADESHFSLSSEEGIYSLSVLDSDEEDAYSYILDLNKDVFQRVEEETVEEIDEESKHLEACDMFNGHGGSVVQNAGFEQESEDRSRSVVHREFDLDENESMRYNRPVFDMEPEDGSFRKEEPEEEGVVGGQVHDYGEEEREKETEDVRLVTHGYDKTEALIDEAEICKMAPFEEDTDGGLSVKVSEKMEVDEEEKRESLASVQKGQDGNLGKDKGEEGNIMKEKKGNQHSAVTLVGFGVGVNEIILTNEGVNEIRGVSAARIHTQEENDRKDSGPKMEDLIKNCDVDKTEASTDKDTNSMDSEAVTREEEDDRGLKMKKYKLTDEKTMTIEPLGETTPNNDPDGSVNIHAGVSSWTSNSFSGEGGFTLQSLAASCDITPLELEMLLVFWMLLYCCFILPQMNLGAPLL
ncbi:uncharacterized protein clmnb [Hippoglossus stenolepis]|uniref:uncharacterized protein clmnb n=1 Tax=Hippoglossus stenolepis TaxID=195615 RepID=UPI001FAFE4A6|nr:uncharacterized protein clmnb [Hippoglossus stenolepis]